MSSMERPAPGTDPFGPPPISILVGCLHCRQEYESHLIEWRVSPGHDGKPWGHWACPMTGCDGVGFLCDIFPLDPDYRDEDGNRVYCDDGGDEEDFVDDSDDPERDSEAGPA